MDSVSDLIYNKLQEIKPHIIEVVDESQKHKNHSGYKEGGETHFKIKVVSEYFNGLSRVNRHKVIYDLLQNLLKTQIHALSIEAYTTKEFKG